MWSVHTTIVTNVATSPPLVRIHGILEKLKTDGQIVNPYCNAP